MVDYDKVLKYLIRVEFDRLWDSNSLPMASDSKYHVDKDKYFEEWLEDKFKKYRDPALGAPYDLNRIAKRK